MDFDPNRRLFDKFLKDGSVELRKGDARRLFQVMFLEGAFCQ